ncbi:MAG TPA: TetR/AcrR family transcriptional regulator [Thermoanaerobaculia bacterium]|nr:TetR/AcrR family transcriptional regulator [Thermoanaerobaculia bacterium]
MGRPPTISRQQILDSARNVFTFKGFDTATLADIAAHLHVTPAAILRHFESKQALFNEAMRRETLVLPDCILRLQDIDASQDPSKVLRQVAQEWVPFAARTLGQSLVVQMHDRARQSALVLPFDPAAGDSPPRRAFLIVSDYFRRAAAAGVIRVQDPRAATILFMGSLFGYVFIHHVAQALPQPYPLPAYIDALLDLWTEGGFGDGGSDVTRKKTAAAAGDRGARKRRAAVRPADGKTEGSDSGGDAGSAKRQRRIAGGRTRPPRSRR